ncbi:c-type cytochrome [Neptunicoccus cionae]|uniref:c-type cytochrome n=1 Tax=Neptunicoccus cionae TaxID=2035344 RepID=UPI000C768BE6|nr:cytochrome c family protein [Amylibacter cionae]PLS20509.1 cytochrome c family protein [Amylibacter cionae]
MKSNRIWGVATTASILLSLGGIAVAEETTATTQTGTATVAAESEVAKVVIDGDAKKGKRVFNKCKACHKLEAGKNGVGPSLAGLFGRPAAEVEGFRYSDAMINSGIVWTPETLTQYLHKPKDFVPGTKMTFAGLKKDKDINDLLAYLAEEL